MVTIRSGLSQVLDFASDKVEGLAGNPVATGVGGVVVGASLVGAGVAVASAVKKRRRKTAKKRTTKRRTTRRTTKRKPAKKRTKYARTAGKRKDTSKRRIRMTKNGQPYIILASGKARFIKKSSARTSRKRKGGRY